MKADGEIFEKQFVSQTSTYIDRIEACLALLPRLIDQYAADEPFRRTADRISELETACDRANRRVSSLIANASVPDIGIRLTRLHLNAELTLELYPILDDVANAAEQFAEELTAISPSRSRTCLQHLREMAEIAVDVVTVLRETVVGCVRMLCDPDCSITISDEIRRIRTAESECDELRNELVAAAFENEPGTTALVYRELGLLLDAAVDTIEDVTDHLILINGNQSWITVEPEGEGSVSP